jgi:DNA-binding MarR family transcriptional regulator
VRSAVEPLPPEAFPPLGEALEFLRVLWAIDHGLQRHSKHMAAALGITGPQRLVVRVVGRFPGLSAGQLAEILHLHPSTLTGVLRRLVRKGLLTRHQDPRDRRRAVLGLTAAGRRLAVEASGTIESVMKRALGGHPPREAAAARQVLSAVAESLKGSSHRARNARMKLR